MGIPLLALREVALMQSPLTFNSRVYFLSYIAAPQ